MWAALVVFLSQELFGKHPTLLIQLGDDKAMVPVVASDDGRLGEHKLVPHRSIAPEDEVRQTNLEAWAVASC